MSFSFIFIGSTHGFIDDFFKQKEVILKVKPEFVLCEGLEDLVLNSKDKFEKLFQKRKISNMNSFEEIERLVKLCFDNHIKLIGIDFRNLGLKKGLQEKIKNQEKISSLEERELNNIISLREKRHLDNILEYKKKSSRPIVIIVGCWHLRKESLLIKGLENYKLILPCNRNNRPLFAPTNNKPIKYVEITSDGNKIKN